MGETDVAMRALAAIKEQPGLSTSAVASLVGIDPSTAEYHLLRAQRRGAVGSQIVGRGRCWFVAGSGHCPFLKRAIPAMRRDGMRAVALALEETPLTSAELSRRTGIPVGQVRWALSSLEMLGAIERNAAGHTRLRDGTSHCIANAAEGRACDRWGSCPLSQVWRAGAAGERSQPPPKTLA